MKKHIILSALLKSSIIQLFIIINCILFSGCTTKYHAKGIDEVVDILVVEGIITDYESTINLTRSVNINEEGYWDPISVDNANVYVECDDGTQTQPALYIPPDYSSADREDRIGKYIIETGRLNMEHRYRLKIETNNYEYASEFSYPIKTPEIDSIFWIKREEGEPVMIYIATHVPDDDILYFRWSYKEDWEINAPLDYETNVWPAYVIPYRCWSKYSSRDLFLVSPEKTVFGKVAEIITKIPPSDKRLSVLYRIVVKQNAISKRAYDYFVNIKKNSENIGTIFASTPSELRGNITCITQPGRPAIGYIDVSSTTQKTQFISQRDNDVYEAPHTNCRVGYIFDIMEFYEEPDRNKYVQYPPPEPPPSQIGVLTYTHVRCVDCRYLYPGRIPGTYIEPTTQKPDDWPR